MMRAYTSRRLLGVLVLLFICGAALLLYLPGVLHRPPAGELFRKHVLAPIPASVTHLKADQPMAIGGYGYVLRFAVSRADFGLVAESRPFRETETCACIDGYLEWTWKNLPSSGSLGEIGRGLPVYSPGQRKPSWFDLESWERPEAYVLVQKNERGDTVESQILAYNSGLETAYFIVFHYGGGTPPFFWRTRARH